MAKSRTALKFLLKWNTHYAHLHFNFLQICKLCINSMEYLEYPWPTLFLFCGCNPYFHNKNGFFVNSQYFAAFFANLHVDSLCVCGQWILSLIDRRPLFTLFFYSHWNILSRPVFYCQWNICCRSGRPGGQGLHLYLTLRAVGLRQPELVVRACAAEVEVAWEAVVPAVVALAAARAAHGAVALELSPAPGLKEIMNIFWKRNEPKKHDTEPHIMNGSGEVFF